MSGSSLLPTRRGRQREHLPLFHEVRGEENDQQELRDLDGLEGDVPDVDPELDAVQLRLGCAAEVGRERKDEEDQSREHEHVPVALEVARAPDDKERADVGEHAERAPRGLVVPGRHRVVEAVDHHEPDPVEQEHDRHQDRVRLRGQVAVGHVDHESQGRGRADELKGVGGQRAVGAEGGEQVREASARRR